MTAFEPMASLGAPVVSELAAPPKGVALLPAMLQGLAPRDAMAVKDSGLALPFTKGQCLQREHEVPDRLVIVHAGYVCAERGAVPVMVSGPGLVLPVKLLTREPSVVSFTALTHGVCFSFDLDVVTLALTRNPRVLMHMWDYGMNRINYYQTRVYKTTSLSVEARLASLWWGLGETLEDGHRALPKFITQTDIARLIGVAREELTKRRRMLEKAGFLVRRDKEWVLTPQAPLLWRAQG